MCNHHLAPTRDTRMGRTRSRLDGATLLMLVAGFLSAAQPALGASGCTDTATTNGRRATASAGLQAHIDPATGELLDRPPAGEIPEPLPESPAAVDDVPVEVRPDGTVIAEIGDRYTMALRAEIVDGQLVTCHRPTSQDYPSASAKAPDTGDVP